MKMHTCAFCAIRKDYKGKEFIDLLSIRNQQQEVKDYIWQHNNNLWSINNPVVRITPVEIEVFE